MFCKIICWYIACVGILHVSAGGGTNGVSANAWFFFLLVVRLEESDGWNTTKLGAAVKNANLEDEEVSDQFTSKLLDEFSGGSSGSTCKDDVSNC